MTGEEKVVKMSDHDARQHDWLSKYLGQLEGATIESAVVAVSQDFGHLEMWPTIQVVTEDGRRLTLEVSQDEEGNGPGFVAGLPNPNGGEIVSL